MSYHTLGADMGFEVETKVCTAVTDAELGELESLSVDSPNALSMGVLSKQTENGFSSQLLAKAENLEVTYSVPLRG